jgi:hypothetical protein
MPTINSADRANNTRNFTLLQGKVFNETVQLAASTAVAEGAVVVNNGSGRYAAATSTAVGRIGIVQRTVTSADSDYAAGAFVDIAVPQNSDVVFKATRSAGTLTAHTYADLADSVSVDGSTSTKKHLFVKEVIDANTAKVTFAGNLLGGAFPLS